MGTSLTPELWARFAVLLVAAVGITLVLTAWLDTLAVRLLHRVHRADRVPTRLHARRRAQYRRGPVARRAVAERAP